MGLPVLTLSRFIHLGSGLQATRNAVRVALSPNGGAFLCWHPEPTFPYEHTRPVPRKPEELERGDSVLKVQHLIDERNKYSPDGPDNKQLKDMFFTTKHRWHPKPRRRFAKPGPEPDREGL